MHSASVILFLRGSSVGGSIGLAGSSVGYLDCFLGLGLFSLGFMCLTD